MNKDIKDSFLETTRSYLVCYERFLSLLSSRINLSINELTDIWENPVITENTRTESKNACSAIIKSGSRKGSTCGARAKNGDFCFRHNKQEKHEKHEKQKEISQENRYVNLPDPSEKPKFRLNKHGMFEFNRTGLILRNEKDKRIWGRQHSDGTILPLEPCDIEICKKYRLKYIPPDIETEEDQEIEKKKCQNVIKKDYDSEDD